MVVVVVVVVVVHQENKVSEIFIISQALSREISIIIIQAWLSLIASFLHPKT